MNTNPDTQDARTDAIPKSLEDFLIGLGKFVGQTLADDGPRIPQRDNLTAETGPHPGDSKRRRGPND